ncbi:efflux transporter outer membrane subunit [Roseomonas elaeocarpi]|uniref:Efflux transporter outer membrane subunit n=1 Tax=Roseomonas elaeocarpi TaxID=907779 RepID=A0ABV6JP47_9PROT
MRFSGTWLALGLGIGLAGCTVGPDFVPPANQAPSRWWGQDGRQGVSSPAGITYGAAVDARWWMGLGDPVLSALVERLAAENLDLMQATERVQQGRAQRKVVASEGLPHIEAHDSYERMRSSPTGPSSLFEKVPGAPREYDDWRDSLGASWELDLFGRVRRAVEAETANTEALDEARHGIALMAVADLVQNYIQLRGVQRLLAITGDNLANARKNVGLVRDRFANGVSTTLDIANAEAQRATIQASLPQLRTEEAQLVNAIGLLLGQPPRALEDELSRSLPQPVVPPAIPVGLPADLARRRPDVREAEARLHAATAQTGFAVASFYPDVRLMGNAGTESLQFGRTFDLHSAFFSVGPSIDLPIFEGGRLRGTLRLRESQQRQAAISYRETVLRAWNEVDNALTAFEQARRRRDDVAEAVKQNTRALTAARQRYVEGTVDFLNVIAAENAVLESSRSLAETDTRIAVAFVAIYRSLGGGWETIAP